MNKTIKFIDLFSGIGGCRIGFESACQDLNIKAQCVLSSEIKKPAIAVYKNYFQDQEIYGDITAIKSENIPDFDVLLAGFPCQSFSSAGTRQGLADKRGILFYEIERILGAKKPLGFILENVPNLINHEQGKTWQIMHDTLTHLGYNIAFRVLNAKDFGLPQNRERIYIVGTLKQPADLDYFPPKHCLIKDILEDGKDTLKTPLIQRLLTFYSPTELSGKSIKDKRGGDNNIHSWDLELKGTISQEQKDFLNFLLKERRKKKWAEKKGIKWMDGMPLTLEEIAGFYEYRGKDFKSLEAMLKDLTAKGYLKYEHPKDEYEIKNEMGQKVKKRIPREDIPKGYNIVTGKLSFEINKILDPDDISPTMVATDMERIGVIDQGGIRRLSIREGLRLFGFPEDFELDLQDKEAFDLLGNTVPIPVLKAVSIRLLEAILTSIDNRIMPRGSRQSDRLSPEEKSDRSILIIGT